MIFLLKDEKDADRVACFQRPPKKYTSKDEPWVRNRSHVNAEGSPLRVFSFLDTGRVHLSSRGSINVIRFALMPFNKASIVIGHSLVLMLISI